MIVADKYEVPDTCPSDCKYSGDLGLYGQNSICIRCPVFNCQQIEVADGQLEAHRLPPEHYRADWAKEWAKFFETGVRPVLNLTHEVEP